MQIKEKTSHRTIGKCMKAIKGDSSGKIRLGIVSMELMKSVMILKRKSNSKLEAQFK